jgi:dihydroorotase
MAHCEDTARINAKMAEVKQQYGDDPDVRFHPIVRDHEACYQSTALAVRLAKEEGARLHVAHITTARELELFEPDNDKITAEVCIPHLLFTEEDYKTLGTRIKCNPAIKSAADRDALRKALTDGRIRTVGTDHAPHLLKEKEGGCCKAMSGMPMVQFSLPAMLGLTEEGILSIERLVELMCHNPARLYGIKERGFIRKGYKADLTLVRKKPWTVTGECIESLCAWSPLEGKTFDWQVEKTWVNGQLVWNGTSFPLSPTGEKVLFDA